MYIRGERVTSHTIEPALFPKKPNFVLRVAAHQAHYDGLFLAALEPVHGAQFNAGICFFEHSRKQGYLCHKVNLVPSTARAGQATDVMHRQSAAE